MTMKIQVMGMVFDGLFLVDREGSVVLKGIEGDVRPYNGTDYTYKGIADCDIVENQRRHGRLQHHAERGRQVLRR